MVSFVSVYEAELSARFRGDSMLRRAVLAEAAIQLTELLGLSRARARESRLLTQVEPVSEELSAAITAWIDLPAEAERIRGAHRLGQLLDCVQTIEARVEQESAHNERQRTGSYFTPDSVARAVTESVAQLLDRSRLRELRVCDPAVGGGSFLLEAARVLVREQMRAGSAEEEARRSVFEQVYGIDRFELAVEVSEFAVWLYLGDEARSPSAPERFLIADTLLGQEFESPDRSSSSARGVGLERDFPHLRVGFDWLVGNPPWVAFQGRATRPLPQAVRAYYRANYRAFRGYPTLHGMFVEKATELAPRGIVSFLLPSSLSDLDGYAQARACLTATHCPLEPLEEYGQDAFSGVVQPCFALVASPRAEIVEGDTRSWRLNERSHKEQGAQITQPPEVILRLASLEAWPAGLFRELGFQTNRAVSESLLLRAAAPREPYSVPLLEGRRVREFRVEEPALFLKADRALLDRYKCSLRAREVYQRVEFVVRQTAPFPIAALHTGERFRNSLLAGFSVEDLDAPLVVGLLNSALYRAFHVAHERDARQATFPQVKVAHLRRLPRPPPHAEKRARVRALSELASERGALDETLRSALHQAVFELFELSEGESAQVLEFLRRRAPGALTSLKARGAGRGST